MPFLKRLCWNEMQTTSSRIWTEVAGSISDDNNHYTNWSYIFLLYIMTNTQEGYEQYWTSPGGNTPTEHQLYGHLPPITKTIQARRTRHVGHCWRSRDELIGDVLLWTPTYGRAKVGRPARTYIQQLCEDTGCSPEDLPKAMNDREK